MHSIEYCFDSYMVHTLLEALISNFHLRHSFFVQHVEADTREELSEIHETKTISQATLDIQGQIPTTPAHPYEIVLKSNSTFGNEQDDVSLQVLVSFVPLKIATPLGRLEDPEASLEADMLRISIDLGAQMYSLDDPEVRAIN